MVIKWKKKALKDFKKWEGENPKIAKKIGKLIESIDKDGPINGIGRPEALINRKECSRRITDWDRLIYRIDGDTVTVLSCRNHQGWNFKKGKYL